MYDDGAALRRVVIERPDVVLLDLAMPGMDGEDVREGIRELSPATGVVCFTAKVDPFDRAELKRLRREGDGILTKPATRGQILSAIHRVLEVGPRNDRLDTGNRTVNSR
jgi:CheY-like chemotaxis protein